MTPRARALLIILAVLLAVAGLIALGPSNPDGTPRIEPLNQGPDVMVCGEALDGLPGTACFHPADVPPGATGTYTIPGR